MMDNAFNFSFGEPGDPREKRGQDEEIGNNMSIGNDDGSAVSDLETDDAVEEIHDVYGGSGDDRRSADSGINPRPEEVDPKKIESNHPEVENADTDKQNPYPDEYKPDTETRMTSTWMISGLNLMI